MELKNLRNMKVTYILIIGDALCKISKFKDRRLRKLEIEHKIKTLESTALLKSDRLPIRLTD